MITGCNIWMFFFWNFWFLTIRFEYCNFLNFYERYIGSLEWVVFNIFLLIDATDRIKISSDQKGLFFAVCLYPLSFSINLDATVIFRYNKLLFKAELQGRKVPNIAYLPNVTLNVRFGHAYYDNCFSNSFCAKCNFQLNKLFPK